MNKEDLDFYWYWFVNIPGIGNLSRLHLMERYGHPSRLYQCCGKDLEGILDASQQEAFDASKDHRLYLTKRRLLLESGIRFIHYESEDYPPRFRQLYDPPYGLYVKGRLPKDCLPAVAMVGSRKATAYGRMAAREYASAFAREGIAVISGMAAGIDAASHRACLEQGGVTLGILGGGIDSMYPKNNWNLYLDMYDHGGIMSEYNLGVVNHAGLFPMRNRLISAMADVVLVVEAGFKSGSLITADSGMEQGRDIFALPGRISDVMSRGCNHLIAQGAYITESPQDIIDHLKDRAEYSSHFFQTTLQKREKEEPAQGERRPILTEKEESIVNLLDLNEAVSFDQLLIETGYSISDLQHILMEMELKKYLFQSQQNMYVKNFL